MATVTGRREATTAKPQTAGRRGDKLDGRIAMVTGGNRGIGAAIARSLAQQGATVAIGYGRAQDQAEAVLGELKQLGVEGSIHQGNVGSAHDCRRVVAEVLERHGRLDILVNNAGITSDKPVLKMEEDDWYKVLAVNLSGAFFMSQAALPNMLSRCYGRIINISSLIGQRGSIGQANYAASKSGLFGLTMTLAREAALALQKGGSLTDDSLNVTVNCVAPGYTMTEMVGTVPEKVLDKIKAQIPLGRLGTPDEVARVVHFLAADASNYITGQVWAVNGGMEMAGA